MRIEIDLNYSMFKNCTEINKINISFCNPKLLYSLFRSQTYDYQLPNIIHKIFIRTYHR